MEDRTVNLCQQHLTLRQEFWGRK